MANGTKKNNVTTGEKKVESIFMAITPAIVRMHELGNNKAISKDFAAGCGAGETAYVSWVKHIDDLYEIVAPWAAKFNDKKATDEEIAEIYKAVFPKWRMISRVGEEECNGHNNMFVRESDAVRICNFAMKHGKTDKGSIDVATGKKVFRKEIETMLGIRLAQNAIMTDTDYDLVKSYEKAVSNKEKAENRLEGYTRGGKEVKGLREALKDAEKVLEDMKLAIIGMGADDKAKAEIKKTIDQNPIIGAYAKTVTDINSQIGQAEKQLKNAETFIKEKKKDYDAIMAKIEKIK